MTQQLLLLKENFVTVQIEFSQVDWLILLRFHHFSNGVLRAAETTFRTCTRRAHCDANVNVRQLGILELICKLSYITVFIVSIIFKFRKKFQAGLKRCAINVINHKTIRVHH